MTNYQPRRSGTTGQRERFACRDCGRIMSKAGLVWYATRPDADKRTGFGWAMRCRASCATAAA